MPDRIQLSRAKGWRMPPNTVKVDRSTICGNPWKAGKAGKPGRVLLPATDARLWLVQASLSVVFTVEDSVTAFRLWLLGGDPVLPTMLNEQGRRHYQAAFAARRDLIARRMDTLRGHDLACWCKPGQPCHADVLMEIANA